ncbi:multidrug transporter subunit MdtN [Nitratireductor kimnyeongensis]|uniref:Multidrug transporter subunit MdtN n=1 Tax=Nitratireductor kimnyeongensis TaxID=430679 RepID=A0ABW0TC29_9HYPH|nr:multidrug transporter subunit MdtN [Nitratireductor kimnyeongensis]QZZ36943.1 multidrug transporter subunit MdtN [Nitratireductor kimnyeongensis]
MKSLPYRRLIPVVGAIVSLAIIAGAGALALRSHSESTKNPLSDDASLDAETVSVAAGVAGRIKALHVRENSLVSKGDLLVELDDAAYRLAVEQTRADLEIAMAAANDQTRNIQAERANAQIAAEQVERAKANLELATQTLDRLLPMQSKGYVSAQQIDDARTIKRDAEVSLNEALRQVEAANALIGDEEGTEALIRARRAALNIAEHELKNTVIRAPSDGRIVDLTVGPGAYVLPAQTMFTLIKTDQWFATANYTETTLPAITVGDCATVYALADRKRPLKGKVESIGWGVSSKDFIKLPAGLPIVPKSLDWVRVQQRFPVRIQISEPPADLMRVGASAVSIVHTDGDC